MKLTDAMSTRKSIRGFKPDPVSKETLQEILSTAVQSPSAMNTQPWRLYVVTGEALENTKKDNIASLSAGTMPEMEVKFEEKFQGPYKTRQVDLAKQLFQLMDIQREDAQGRFEWMQRGFRYFDAPVVVVLAYENVMAPTSPLVHFDLGLIAHAVCLTALKYDLGTCIHGQGAMYPQNLRKYVEISAEETIFNCISIGTPDWDFPANKVESAREAVEDVTKWIGF